MKNLNLFVLIAVIFSSFFTSCQKDQLEDMSPIANESTEQAISTTNETTSENSPIDINLLKEKVSQSFEIPSRTMSASSRSGGDELIFDKEDFVSKDDIIEITHSKSRMGSGRYRVVLTSSTGNANLILAGEHSEYLAWREISYSSRSGSYDDILEYTAWDLRHDEDDLKIVVVGKQSSSFRLEIYRVNENLSTCNNRSAIEKIMETLCFCEVNILYHAEYFGRPVLFVDQRCSELLDAGGISVYDCNGNRIAYTGFVSDNHVQEEYLDIKSKIYECSNGSNQENSDCIWGDDFERYSTGASVAYDHLGGYSELWSAWTSNSPSGIVTSDRTLEFNRDEYGEQDIVFNLGKKSSRIYKVSWEMYIESNSTAYFNIQKSNYRNEFKGGGEYAIKFQTSHTQYQNRWFDVDVYFDLDRNKLKVVIDNGRFEDEINYRADMGGINFYSTTDAHFYLDDVCVQEVNRVPLTSRESATSRSRSTDLGIFTTASKN